MFGWGGGGMSVLAFYATPCVRRIRDVCAAVAAVPKTQSNLVGQGLAVTLACLGQSLGGLFEARLLAGLGVTPLVAVGVGASFAGVLVAAVNGLMPGAQAAAARHRRVGIQLLYGSVWAAALSGATAGLLLWALPAQMAATMLPAGGSMTELRTYLRWRAGAMPVSALFATLSGLMLGSMRHWAWLVATVAGLVVAAGINFFCIGGAGPIPAFGVSGPGLAAIFGPGTSSLVCLVALSRRRDVRQPHAAIPLGLQSETAAAAAQQGLFCLGTLVFLILLGRCGHAAAATGIVTLEVYLFGFVPIAGLGSAALSVVAQRARQSPLHRGPDPLKPLVARLALGAGALGCSIAPTIFYARHWILSHLLAVPESEVDSVPLTLLLMTFPFDAAAAVWMSALFAAGRSVQVACLAITLQWGFFLPLAWIASRIGDVGAHFLWLLAFCWRLLHASSFGALWWHSTRSART